MGRGCRPDARHGAAVIMLQAGGGMDAGGATCPFGTSHKAGPRHKCDQYEPRHAGVARLCGRWLPGSFNPAPAAPVCSLLASDAATDALADGFIH